MLAEESYGEDSLHAQYLINSETGQLRKEALYKSSGFTSINKFIKVKQGKNLTPFVIECTNVYVYINRT